jgi:hypothetical protein
MKLVNQPIGPSLLGELADRVEAKYGDGTLKRFAEEGGINFATLRSYQRVYRAYADEGKVPRGTFSVAKELAKHPQRKTILEKHPKMTERGAKHTMERRYSGRIPSAHASAIARNARRSIHCRFSGSSA